jgi:hypothetical protein
LVVLGIALRVYHYLRNPSLWHDEAALVINVLEKSFAELLGPLRFSEAAPPLFLWLEKAARLVFGESLFALRLLPLLASCAALLLFVPVAKRILPPAAAPWAVMLFAVSDRLLWHACEAKQYSIEALVAVVLMAVWLLTSGWPLWRRAVLLTVLAPPLLCVAYPAAFLYGGLLIAFFLLLCQRDFDGPWFKRWPHPSADWLAFGALCVTVLVTFGLLLAGPIHAQRDETIVSCWDAMSQFPDWAHPATVPGWIVRSTCDLVGYCIKPVGQWLAPLAIGGLLLMWRQGKREWCLLLAAPIFLALIASCIKAYPYGGMRVMTYAAPAVCLLVAAAVPFCLEWITRRHIWAAAPLVVLLVVPVVRAAYCVAHPWQRADCAAAAAYVEQHRERGERVTANHWEYLYYFRRLGGDFVPIEMLGSPSQGRLWLVVTGATVADRQPCLAPFAAPLWTIRDRREFDRTTVCLVERQPLAARTSETIVRRP